MKKFQKDTAYTDYDIDGDGVITDEELTLAKEIQKEKAELRKLLARRRMATYSLLSMGAFTVAVCCSLGKSRSPIRHIKSVLYLRSRYCRGVYGNNRMDEQEVDWDERVRAIKKRIEILKQEVGYYQKGDLKCSQRLNQKLEPQEEKPKNSLDSLRESIIRSGLE